MIMTECFPKDVATILRDKLNSPREDRDTGYISDDWEVELWQMRNAGRQPVVIATVSTSRQSTRQARPACNVACMRQSRGRVEHAVILIPALQARCAAQS